MKSSTRLRNMPPPEAREEPAKTTCSKVKLFSLPQELFGHYLDLLSDESLLPKYPDSPDIDQPHLVMSGSDDADETAPVDGTYALRERYHRYAHGLPSNGPINAAVSGEGAVKAAIKYFLDSYRARNLSPATIDWYRNILQKFARACPDFPRGPEPIEAFLAGITGSDETRHDYYRALKTFFRFMAERRETTDPMAKISVQRPKIKLRPTLDENELYRLLNSATNLRDSTILTLLVDTGIRSGEICGLRVSDIKAETIKVRGKTGEREVPISEQTRRLLEALIASQPGQEYVFLGHKGPLGKDGIYRIVRRHMKKAGITGPKLGSHRLRHAFGRNYLVSGGDLRSLQELMGHKRITTTEIYTNLSKKDLIDKHHQFTPLRAAHAAAQESLWKDEAVKEAEEIMTNKETK